MGTIQPRARGGASIGDALTARKRREEQLGRQRVTLPRPIPAPVASGGIVGMAEVIADAATVKMFAGDFLLRETVTYGDPSDPFAGSPGASKVAVSSWLSTSGHQIILAPGWYDLAVSLRLEWAVETDAPAALTLYMQGGWDTAHNDTSYFARANVGNATIPRFGIRQVASHGPTFINDGDAVFLECRPATVPAADSALGSVVWSITKRG